MPAARKADTVIVAISPDTLEKINDIIPKVKSKSGGDFEILLLSDARHEVIDRYGLLNEAAAAQGRFLPHPTTYVIDKGGRIRWKFTEKNYKIRPTNEMVLNELKKLR
ncbi:MAG: redoxin domain-containing protein [Acidobacteria bacterium]|nr:redoxin domain-containing protein [Acidobacteriota bacterium]